MMCKFLSRLVNPHIYIWSRDKYEDSLKYEDDLKQKDDLKYEYNLKYADDLKYEDNLKYENNLKYDDNFKTMLVEQGSNQSQTSLSLP